MEIRTINVLDASRVFTVVRNLLLCATGFEWMLVEHALNPTQFPSSIRRNSRRSSSHRVSFRTNRHFVHEWLGACWCDGLAMEGRSLVDVDNVEK